jgi:hypothetical protein
MVDVRLLHAYGDPIKMNIWRKKKEEKKKKKFMISIPDTSFFGRERRGRGRGWTLN